MDAGKTVQLVIYILTALLVVALFYLICISTLNFIVTNYNIVAL